MPTPARAAGPPPGSRLVCFFLGEQLFGTPITSVKETVRLRPITPVFHTPSFIVGIASLRGEILAILDLAAMLGLPATPLDHDTHILIVQSGGKRAGLLADRLSDVRNADLQALTPVPPTVNAEAAALLKGVIPLADRPLAIIDLERVFGAEGLAKFERRGA
jgi:purine-binding chemotaxis protein CheW